MKALLASLCIALAGALLFQNLSSEPILPREVICLEPDGGVDHFGMAFEQGYYQGFTKALSVCTVVHDNEG